MPRRRKSQCTVPIPHGDTSPPPRDSPVGPQGLTSSTLHLLEPLLAILVSAGVTDFQGFGLNIRLGHRPAVHPGGLETGAPLTPEAREALLSRLEGAGVDENDPLFDAVRSSS